MNYLSNPENYKLVSDKYLEVQLQLNEIALMLHIVRGALKTERAKDYLSHGLGRRIFMILDVCEYFKSFLKDEKNNFQISNSDIQRHTTMLNTYFVNIAGSLDDIGWIYVYEKNLNLLFYEINIRREKLQKELPQTIKELITENKLWLDHIYDYRNQCAHRIPPYCIPYCEDPKTGEKDFSSNYVHDFKDSEPICLQIQIVNDTLKFFKLIKTCLKALAAREKS